MLNRQTLVAGCAAVALILVCAGTASGDAPPPGLLDQWSARHLRPGWKIFATDWLRYEDWQHFDPAGTLGDPDYGYLFNRFRFGVKAAGDTWSLDAAAQVVNQVSLPDDAVGTPGGPLELGAVYFNHNRSRNPASIYLKALNLGLHNLFGSGVDVTAGRMDYNSSMEATSADATINVLKDMRIDSRLLGPFDWSAYQRSFDGIKVRRRLGPGQFDFAALQATQGGFEHDASSSVEDIDVFTFAYNAPVTGAVGEAELQVFSYLFEDTRRIAIRPGNSGLSAGRQDIDLYNVGGHLVGHVPDRAGKRGCSGVGCLPGW